MSSKSSEPVFAAGGVVLGAGPNSGKIAIVRRQRYGEETALPKGKLQAGEEITDAALREVREETGQEVEIQQFAGSTHYFVGNAPKVVFYFIMGSDPNSVGKPQDTAEIVALEWLTPEKAAATLTHRGERDLVSAVFRLNKSV